MLQGLSVMVVLTAFLYLNSYSGVLGYIITILIIPSIIWCIMSKYDKRFKSILKERNKEKNSNSNSNSN